MASRYPLEGGGEELELPLGYIEPSDKRWETIEQRFWAFHEQNPWVLDALIRLTDDMRARGRDKVGIGMLFEVLRWHSYRQTEGDDYKLNNSFRSRYARLIGKVRPDLADMFEVRELKSP